MTDLNSNRGPIGTRNNEPNPDDGTSAMCQHRAPVPRGRLEELFFMEEDSPRLIFSPPDPCDSIIRAASLDAAKFVIGMELRHRAGIHLYGAGTQSGSDSGDFSQPQVDKMSKGEKVKNKAGRTPINCTELPLQAVQEYFESLGKDDLGTQIIKTSRDSRGATTRGEMGPLESARLTVIIKELHNSGGFETVYLGRSADSRKTQLFGAVNRQKFYPTYAFSVRGADTGELMKDVRAPVDKAFTRYGTKKQLAEYELFIDQLTRTKFAVGTVYGGLHGFVIADGQTYQVHWDKKATSKHLFQVSPVRDFLRQYPDAIVAIPAKMP